MSNLILKNEECLKKNSFMLSLRRSYVFTDWPHSDSPYHSEMDTDRLTKKLLYSRRSIENIIENGQHIIQHRHVI